jgi:hypothetical protein
MFLNFLTLYLILGLEASHLYLVHEVGTPYFVHGDKVPTSCIWLILANRNWGDPPDVAASLPVASG